MDQRILVGIAATAIAIGGLVFVIGSATPAYRRYLVNRFVRDVGLGYPAELRGTVEKQVVGRQRRLGIAMVVGAVLAVAIVLLATPTSDSDGFLTLLLGIGAMIATVTAVQTFAGLLSPRPLDAEEVRYARAAETELGDYVSPLERAAVRVLVPLAVIAVVAAIAAVPERMPALAIVVITSALSVLGLVLFETVGRRIVRRPQHAGSAAELAWSDAQRAADLRDIADYTAFSAGYVVVGCAVAVFSDAAGHWDWRISLINTGWIALVVIAGNVARSRSLQRHVIRRLWPDVAAANELRG